MLTAGLIGSVLALIVVVAAPGNEIRRAAFPPSPSLPDLVLSTAGVTAFYIDEALSRLSSTDLLFVFVLPMWIAFSFQPTQVISRDWLLRRRWLPLVWFVVGFGLMASSIAPSVYGASTLTPAERIYFMAQLTLVLTIGIFGYLVGMVLRSAGMKPSRVGGATAGLIIGGLLVLGPLTTAQQTLQTAADEYRVFAEAFDARAVDLLAMTDAGDVVIAPLVVDMATLARLETVGEDPDFWINRCVARLYGVETIAAVAAN